eukprot:jgi/Orpsp1_1/1175138/evm.model.c7180000052755.1
MSKKAPIKKKREIFPLDFITELFGLSPTEFLDEVFDSANIVSTSVTDAIQEYLDTEYNKKYGDKYKDEIETGICKLENLYQDAIDQSTDVLQLYFINNCLSIPNDISEIELHLPYEKDLDFSINDNDEIKIDNEIKKIKEMIIAKKYINTLAKSAIKQEKEKVEKLEKIKQEIDKLRMTEQQSQVYPLHESLSFLVKNANELELLMERTKKEYKNISFEDMFSEERKRSKYINNSIVSQLNIFNQNMDSSHSTFNNDSSSDSVSINSSSNSNNRLKRSEDYLTSDENKKYAEEYRVLTSITTKENAQ